MGAIVSLIFGLIELLVGARFVFLILGANPSAQLVDWVYVTSGPLVAPFAGILGRATTIPTGAVVHSVFDPATLIAFIVYAAIGGLLVALLGRN